MKKAALLLGFSVIFALVVEAVSSVVYPLHLFYFVFVVAVAADNLDYFEGLAVVALYSVFFDLSTLNYFGMYLAVGVTLHWFSVQYLRMFTIDTLFGEVFLCAVLSILARSAIAIFLLIKGVHGGFDPLIYLTDVVTNIPAFLVFLALHRFISSHLIQEIDRDLLMGL